MRDHGLWLSMAIYRFYRATVDFIATEKATDDHAAEVNMLRQDVISSAANVILSDRDHGLSRDEEYAALFEQILQAEGLSEDECAQARNVRTGVMLLARKSLDASGLQRGADPADCDPGGGMRAPDDRDDDGEQ